MNLVRSTIDGLTNLFARNHRGSQGARAAAGKRTGKPHPKKTHPLDERLGKMVEVKSPVAAGTVFWLGLKEFRDHFGNRWHSVAPKIDAIARKCIEQRLTDAKDSYEKHGDNYALLFAKLNKTEANLQCALIAKDISDRLVGERELLQMVSVGSAIVEVDKEIAHRVAQEGGLGNLLDERAQQTQKESKQSKQKPTSPEKDLANIQLVYQPMWNTKLNVISSYRCLPTRVSNDGRLLSGDQARAMNPLVDIFVLKKAINLLKDITQTGYKNVMVVPVHFSTLKEKALRTEYKSVLNSVPLDLCSLLVFEILGVDDDADFVGLLDPILHLKPSCRTIILLQPVGQKDFSGLECMGLHSVGVDVDGLNEAETDLIPRLQRFAERANGNGFKSYVHGIQSVSLASAAVGAGFNFVSGMAITSMEEALDIPQGIQNFSLKDLFASAYSREKNSAEEDGELYLVDAGDETADPEPEAEKDDRPNSVAAEDEPNQAASEAIDKLYFLTKRLVEENGLPEQDALILAKAKLGITALR